MVVVVVCVGRPSGFFSLDVKGKDGMLLLLLIIIIIVRCSDAQQIGRGGWTVDGGRVCGVSKNHGRRALVRARRATKSVAEHVALRRDTVEFCIINTRTYRNNSLAVRRLHFFNPFRLSFCRAILIFLDPYRRKSEHPTVFGILARHGHMELTPPPQEEEEEHASQQRFHSSGWPPRAAAAAAIVPQHHPPTTTATAASTRRMDADAVDSPHGSVSVFSLFYLEQYRVDLVWSFASDSCFVAGGFAYIALTVWDYAVRDNNINSAYDNPDDVESSSMTLDNHTNRYSYYYYYSLLDIMAPAVYLCNSLVDIYWTMCVQRQLKQQRKKEEQQQESLAPTITTSPFAPAANTTGDDEYCRTMQTLPFRGGSFSSSSVSSSSHSATTAALRRHYHPRPPFCCCVNSNWKKLRQWAAHRRTALAAATFGLAAGLAVVAALVRNCHASQSTANNEDDDDTATDSQRRSRTHSILDACSDHVYILSALISLTGYSPTKNKSTTTTTSTPPNAKDLLLPPPPTLSPPPPLERSSTSTARWYNNNELLEDWGDILFFIGCLMDASLTDFRLKNMLCLPIVSSFLWLLDGCLYMRSDFVRVAHLRNQQWTSDKNNAILTTRTIAEETTTTRYERHDDEIRNGMPVPPPLV